MSEAMRWSAVTTLVWRPVLTFTRRRLELLDWLDETCRETLHSFTDAPDHLGIALNDDQQRMRLERTALRIEMRTPTASVAPLAPALDHTLSLFADEQPVPALYYSAWSHPLVGEYEQLCQRLARSSVAADWPETLPRPSDGALLLDFDAKFGSLKIEYGVVSAIELAARLAHSTGRLAPHSALPRPAVNLEVSDLPPASLFLEAYVEPFSFGPVATAADVADFIREIEDTIRRMVYSLAFGLQSNQLTDEE